MEQGGSLIHQSHKNLISQQSLEMFLRMARNYDIVDQFPQVQTMRSSVPSVESSLLAGLKQLQQDRATHDPQLNRFRQNFYADPQPGETVPQINLSNDDETMEVEDNNNDIQEI